VLERLQASDARRDRSADPIRLARDVQARIALGQPRRSDDQVREAVHAPRLFAVDELGRVEVLHLAREVHRILARIELRDLTGATTLARTFRLPTSRASDFVKPMIPAFEAP